VRKDNMFYTEPGKLVPLENEQEPEPETVSYEELYERWMLPSLLGTPPIKLYPKSLVDFAELVLENPFGDIDWFSSAGLYNLKSILGHSLEMAAVTGEKRKFSSVALAFVGYKFEVGYFAKEDPRGTEAMCNELISYMEWVPKYFRIDANRKILKGTKMLRRESGMRVWLDYESIW
jgi:hypothetical protein